jgi:ectoine hydroxylase-related dioxygenase (phytanoyl-CoA dioxygenase family)
MSGVRIGDDQVRFFQDEGYLIVREVLSAEEVELLRAAAVADKKLDENSFSVKDGEGGAARLALWNHPGSSIYGMIARSETVVNAMERLLGEEVYHYHSKMIMKDARTGGAWTWHQDYGYWYHNGVIKPDLASISIAIDPSTRENGCLQIVPRSHKLGRIDHTLSGNQAGADMARVEKILERLPIEYVVLNPGDAVVFHSNLLDDLLLQHRVERSVSRRTTRALHEAAQGAGLGHPRGGPQAHGRGNRRRGVDAQGQHGHAAPAREVTRAVHAGSADQMP